MKKILLAVMLVVAMHSHAQVFWTETFSNSCASGCLASSYAGPNGGWTVTSTGVNTSNSNIWFVSGTECGNAAGQCGTGCGSTDPSLHIGANLVPIVVDPGAAYYAGVASYWRVESPIIDCSGKSNLTISFNYIQEAQPGSDFTALAYYDGTTWYYYETSVNGWTTTFTALPITGNASCAPQGYWTANSVSLPASANNNPNVKIGFRWVNDNDGLGNDPSFAVDDINISSSGGCSVNIIAGSPILCYGDCNATLIANGIGALPVTYQWNTVPVQNTAVASGLCAGTYTVTFTDGNGCTATAVATVTQPAELVIDSVVLSNYNGWNVSCNGACDGTATPLVSGGTPPILLIQQINICAGTYTATVTDANGCTATASFTIIEPPLLTLTISVDTFQGGWNVSCNGSCDALGVAMASGGTPSYSYLWSNGCAGQSCPNLCAGVYTVWVTDVNGCTASASYTVTEPPLLIMGAPVITNTSCTACSDGSICLGSHSGGTPAYTYSLTPNLGNFNGNCWQNLPAGIYTICITDANGCTICITDTLVDPPSGFADNFSFEEIILSPNIISNSAILTVPFAEGEFSFAIYDSFGKKVSERIFTGKETTIEKGNLSPGIYFFKLTANQRRFYGGKFIIE